MLWQATACIYERRHEHTQIWGQGTFKLPVSRSSTDILVRRLLLPKFNHLAIPFDTIVPFPLNSISRYLRMNRLSYQLLSYIWLPGQRQHPCKHVLRLNISFILSVLEFQLCLRMTSSNRRLLALSLSLRGTAWNAFCNQWRHARRLLAMMV